MIQKKKFQPMIYVNGRALPYPKEGLNMIVTTTVNSARNANAEVVGQKIGRDQYKLDALEFPWLSADDWAYVLQCFSEFYANVTFTDPVTNQPITLKMYPGDRSATPYWVGEDGRPTWFRNCKVNIIDCGVT